MLSVYFHKSKSCHEQLSLKDLLELLEKGADVGDVAVVRGVTDRIYFDLATELQEVTNKAMRGAQLIGGVTRFWTIQSSFVDGEGWRLLLGVMQATAQMGGGPR